MRKNQPKPIVSSRPNLHYKSPQSKQKVKLASPIHSYRPSSNRKQKTPSKQQELPKPNLIWLPSPTLYSFFHPLERTLGRSATFRLTIGNKEKDEKICVISTIDSFIETYMELNDQMKVECQKWYIISSAVNWKETESEFNSLYSPIHFIFLPSISSVCNSLLGFSNENAFAGVEGIYDLSLVSSQQFLCVEETILEDISVVKQNSLYILNDAKQWMLFSTKINAALTPYFITGCEEFRDQRLCVKQHRNKEKAQLVFIFFQFERNFRQISGFLEYEAKFRSQIKSPTRLAKLNTKNQVYMSKIVEKLILPTPSNVCIFYEPLSTPLLQLSQIRQKLNPAYFLLPSSLYKPSDNAYKLKYNTRTRNCQQVAINSAMAVGDQIKKIQSFIEEKNKLAQLFTPHLELLRKMQIYCYQKQRNYHHCITNALEICNVKVGLLKDLQCLVQINKITLIYGCFSYAEVKSVDRFYNVFLVPLGKQAEQTTPFNQISEAHSFLEIALKSYNQVYSEPATRPREAFIHILYEEEKQLPQIMKALSIQEALLKTHFIGKFHLDLISFHDSSKHFIIAPMDIFSEQLESQIRQFQWKCNTVIIEVYLQYGQQFIYRNKEQSYKFVKASELQAKIKELEEQYELVKNRVQAEEATVKEGLLKLEGLEEVEEMGILEGELEDLVMEESIVQRYVERPKQTLSQQNQKRMQQGDENSFIQLLSESRFNQVAQVKEEEPEKCSMSEIIGQQTKKLIEQSEHYGFHELGSRSNSHRDSQSSLKLRDQPNPPTQRDQNPKQLEKKEQRNSEYQKTSPVFNRNPKRKSNQKIGLVKHHRQQKPIKANQQIEAQLQQQVEELNNLKSLISKSPQFYKLYIFIHRSVPLHSLARRHQKEYHILVYTRLEEILVFLRYLKPEEKVVVIANDQSRQIYGQLVLKSKISQDNLKIIFSKDLSEHFVRTQVDKILEEAKLQQASKKSVPSKFRALIVYSANNERVQKAIKITKKIFGSQLKLVFLKEKQYEEMTQSKFNFRISSNVAVYKIGLPANNHETSISSIRSLFILAMHPDLKGFAFEFGTLYFSIEAYLGRILYGSSEKNYVLANKKIKGSDSLRKKVQGMKSQTNFFRSRDSHISYIKSQNSQRRLSQTARRSSVSRSSGILRSSSSISIIVSSALKEFYSSKNTFYLEADLISHILAAYSMSKLAIVVISEKEFDMFELFQTHYFEEASKEIVWVIETQTEGKQVFNSDNMVFTLGENIREAIQNVVKEYEHKLNFDELQIESRLQSVESGRYGEKKSNELKSQCSRTLHLLVMPKIQQSQLSVFSRGKSSNKIIITLNSEKKENKFQRNLIEMPSVESVTKLAELLARKFEKKVEQSESECLGSMLVVSNRDMQRVKKMMEGGYRRNVVYKAYDPGNISSLITFSFLRVLIIVDKDCDFKYLATCPFALEVDAGWEKVGKRLAELVL